MARFGVLVALVIVHQCAAWLDVSPLLHQTSDVSSSTPKADNKSCPTPLTCPAGFTGFYCDIQLCDNRGVVHLPRPDLGFAMDIRVYKTKCAAAVSVPVDTHTDTVYLMVDGQDHGSNPTLSFMKMGGTPMSPIQVITNDTKTLVLQYNVENMPGLYMAQFSASQPCIYQSHALSDLVVPVGFVSGRRATHNDHPHLRMYDGDFSFAIMHSNKLPKPGHIRAVELYADADLVHSYKPKIRYGCAYDMYFGPMTCNANSTYYYKVFGIDEYGYSFQRTDMVYCDPGKYTTTSGPPTTTEGPCKHGGHMDHGKCVCTSGWTGDTCEKIVCFNGGTVSPANTCLCPISIGGDHCDMPMCSVPSPVPMWTPNYRSMGFVLQNTKSQWNNIAAMKDYITSIIQDFIQHHPDFVVQYTLHTFDDKDAYTLLTTNDPLYMMEYVHHIVPSNETGECKKKATLGLIHALASTLPYGYVYVITDSPDIHDLNQTLAAHHLLEFTKATVNYFVPGPWCGDIEDVGYEIYNNLALFSGGQVFYPKDGSKAIFQLINTIQTAYKDNVVNEGYITDCSSKPLQMHVEVDSRTVAFSVAVHGDSPTIKLYQPNGKDYNISIDLVTDSRVKMVQAITPCDQSWEQHGHQCYMGNIKPTTWKEAQDFCHDHGGTLISILNQEKQTFLDHILHGGLDYWTGLNDIPVEGNYEWDTLGFKIPLGHYYLNWADGQPDDATHTKNCMAVLHKNTTAKWYDKACTDKLPFICEKHAYDEDANRLPPGVWRAEFSTATGACYVTAHSQSDLQAYYGFADNMFNDFPDQEPDMASDQNFLVANVSNLYGDGMMQKANFWTEDFKPLDSYQMHKRLHCSYHYISDPFECPQHSFGIVLTGLDDMGYPWQRIRTAVCFNATDRASAAEWANHYVHQVMKLTNENTKE